MRIGLFDSGVGGLTVLKRLKEKYPHNDYIYYGDTLNVPYDNKTMNELLNLAIDNMNFLLSKEVDMIIVACGTVSSNCMDYLKDNYKIPIKSVITPTILYINNSNYEHILVIATQATVDTHYFKNKISKDVTEVAIPELASLIEKNHLNNLESLLHNYLDPYINNKDLLVLGCTHYPIVSDVIAKVVNNNIDILDMATLIDIPDEGNGTTEIYYSKLDDIVINNTKKILNDNVVKISLSNNN